MIKTIKKSVLLLGLLFSLLVLSGFFSSFAVVVSAVESDVQDKTIDVLNAVIGINTAGFIIDLN